MKIVEIPRSAWQRHYLRLMMAVLALAMFRVAPSFTTSILLILVAWAMAEAVWYAKRTERNSAAKIAKVEGVAWLVLLLGAVLWGALTPPPRIGYNQALNANRLKQLGLACYLYLDDYGQFPPHYSLALDADDLPEDNLNFHLHGDNFQYDWLYFPVKGFWEVDNIETHVMMASPTPWRPEGQPPVAGNAGTRTVLFLDGHVESRLPEADYQALIEQQLCGGEVNE